MQDKSRDPFLALADRHADAVRRLGVEVGSTSEGALDLLGYTLRKRPMSGSTWGLTHPDGWTMVNSNLDQRLQRYAIAHEIGHILVFTGRVQVPPHRVEWFADLFGHELLLPHKQLASAFRREPAVLKATEAPEITIAMQLLRTHSDPAIRCSNGMVVCRSCGHRPHLPACLCVRLRTSSALAERLPSIDALAESLRQAA